MKKKEYVPINQTKCNRLAKETIEVAKKLLDVYEEESLIFALKRISKIEEISQEDEVKIWNKIYQMIG